jgi:hypothetical protein
MSMNDGGPAFPVSWTEMDGPIGPGPQTVAIPGMSLRDWFAGNAMNRLLTVGGEAYIQDVPTGDLKFIMARKAYEMADAMIAERDRRAKSA